MKWFKIDGREWKVRVFEPKESFTILYSENTSRVLDVGAPVALDPLGTFFNYTLTVGKITGEEAEFDELWEYVSVPRFLPMLVVLPKNRNTLWKSQNDEGVEVEGFYAYVSSGERAIKKITEEQDGTLKEVFYDAFTLNIRATRAQVLPEVVEE